MTGQRSSSARSRSRAALLVLLSCSLTLATAACRSRDKEPDLADVKHLCSSCHGVNGLSTSPNFPHLAGQQPDYIIHELTSFRDHTRADRDAHTYMWGMALRLSDQTIALLAVDYAHQTPPVGIPGDPKRVAAGGQLYHSGNPETGVPACITCHGAGALGAPAQDQRPAAPRLAGQHRDYLDKQLTMFASNARENKTMHQNAVNLGAGQIGLLADYLAAQ